MSAPNAAERWQHVATLFDELVELTPAECAARLDAIAASDTSLAAELRSLLDADARDNLLLDSDAAALVPQMLADRNDSLGPGDAAGPYRLLRLLGEGGMGVVYLAERTDGAYEQRVAVKLLKRGMDTHAVLRRFLQERRILARLTHPHIVRLLDGGMSADGRPYYVMEYVAGLTISAHAAARRLGVRERVALLAQVADAVAYAHAQLVVHRDLKPSNVLVEESGEPRVLDFGIAKLIEDSGEETVTGTALRVMSPAYAAPEQILGEAIGTATDVYALGLLLCELLTGRLAHSRVAATPHRLAQDVAHETIERPSVLAARATSAELEAVFGPDSEANALSRTLRGDLDVIVMTALQREPSRRYATAAAFADDLRRWLDGRPIAARADTAMYRAAKFVRRHRIGVAASVVAALSLLGGFGVAVWQAREARAAATTAQTAEETAQQQAAIATAVSDFLTRDVIQAVNPYRNKLDIRLTDALLKAGERIDERFRGNPRLAGVVRRELADALYFAGEIDPAQAHARQALVTLEGAFGAADTDALQTRVTLGLILHKQDHFAEARSVYDEGLRTIGSNGPLREQLELAVGLAGINVEDRREDEALKALAVLTPQVEAEFGAFEPLHVRALDHQMRALMGSSREEEALVIARRLRAGTEKKFGVGDAQTLEWIKREGIALTVLERYDEALPIMQQACAATSAHLGAGHFATADCNLRLSIVLFNKERFAEAAVMMADVAALRERLFGKDSESTWLSWIWLARAYQHTDRRAQARELFERVYANASRVNGESDPNTLPFAQTLGMFLEQTGAHAEAEVLRRKILGQAQSVLPAGHAIIVKFAWDLGETLASQKRDEETIAFYAIWLPQWDQMFGTSDSRATDAHKWLAEAQQRRAASKK
jgi:tetratricopeptide (TPR) repeat protein/tRNA A-37 threonylcarbamoyl transferase component Bud32